MLRNLLTKTITTAVTDPVTGSVYFTQQPVLSALIRGNLAYGSGGTTIDAYVQTSLDGNKWGDVCNFHFTTANADLYFNLSALTAQTTQFTPVDGAIANNTCKDGYLGQWWRVKYKSSGTYGGANILRVDCSFKTALIS